MALGAIVAAIEVRTEASLEDIAQEDTSKAGKLIIQEEQLYQANQEDQQDQQKLVEAEQDYKVRNK